VLLLIGVMWLGHYVLSRGYLLEGFVRGSLYQGGSDYSYNVALPLNTTGPTPTNICGPKATCSTSGGQCQADVDCNEGNYIASSNTSSSSNPVRGENDAGKLTPGSGLSFSTLTTDIGTQSAFYNEDANVPQYFKGVNTWSKQFLDGQDIYLQAQNRYDSQELVVNMPKYSETATLSGEFSDNGPLASNAYLSL